MERRKHQTRGFTLIATLMVLFLLSGIAIGMLMMVNTEGKVGTQDIQNNTTFHAAEGAIEKMTSDLAASFQNIQAPTVSQIEGLSALVPTGTYYSAGISFPVYSLTPATDAGGNLLTSFGQIASGPYGGLYAQLLPVTLQATAQGPLGDEVSMSRTVQVALIPVFQFGVFSDSDLSFFAGVNLDFAGRVHTNGDLYLSSGDGTAVTFHDKVTAWGNVVRTQLADGVLITTAPTHQGNVAILTQSQGCDGAKPNCRNMATAEASVTGGPTSPQNPAWHNISIGTYNGWVIDGNYGNPGGTGASQLQLPFVAGTGNANNQPQPYEIIRRPPVGEDPTTPLGAARLYNEAAIRIMLSDRPEDLPGGAASADNVRLANFSNPNSGIDYTKGVPITGTGNTMYFATASTAIPEPAVVGNPGTRVADWLYAPEATLGEFGNEFNATDGNVPMMWTAPAANFYGVTQAPPYINVRCNMATNPPTCPPYPYYTPLPSTVSGAGGNSSGWNLLDGYLRVEYRNAAGAFVPITREWLGLGFARGLVPPVAPGGNGVAPNAILLLQEPAKRTPGGALDNLGVAPNCTKSGGVWTCTDGTPPEVAYDQVVGNPFYGVAGAGAQSITQYNWYPINLYDAREGEPRDVIGAGNTCTPVGVLNVVELDVGNLKRWLAGNIPGSGTLVDFVSQNGYVLYFSDRRGMLPNPNGTQVDPAGTKSGDSGFEDSVNLGSQNGNPDGALEGLPPGKTQSPEDVNNNGRLDNWGAANLGLGLGYVPLPGVAPGTAYNAAQGVNNLVNTPASPDPYLVANRMPSCLLAQKNWVSGARHALKLVDGSLGNVPVRPDLAFPASGGFTAGSENPVYIYGDYNTAASPADPTWTNPNAAEPAHSAAAVIADAVTMLSNGWSDLADLNSPSNDAGRNAATTYYRVAISAGKNINFPTAGLAWRVGDFGTDGGLHNFLRQLERWSGQTLNYKGSMVSMYYSTYVTGEDKNGGGTVYEPPARNYIFDPMFTQPQNLPPGTPMFRDIDNLSYRQNFNPCTVQGNGKCAD